MTGSPTLLEAEHLAVHYRRGRGAPPLRAVDDVSFSIAERETVGLVGESGSGKSTIGRAILGLVPVTSGRITFAGSDISHADLRTRRRLSRDLQVVFQDPYSSLSPTRTIGQTLREPLQVHADLSRKELDLEVAAILEKVGLPVTAADRYPTQFSGGQRQRIALARALIVKPRLVVCDEPVAALDLSVQAQVLNLLRELQRDLGLSYLFVAHDLDVVRHLSQRIMVMYAGQIMEYGAAPAVYGTPRHPYTQALLTAVPVPDPELQRRRRKARVEAEASPAAASDERGCPFNLRCLYAIDVCRAVRPRLEATDTGARVACHRWHEISVSPESLGQPKTGASRA